MSEDQNYEELHETEEVQSEGIVLDKYDEQIKKYKTRMEGLNVKERKFEVGALERQRKNEEDALRLAKLHSLSQLLCDTVLDEENTLPGSDPARKLMIDDEIDRRRIHKKIFEIINNMSA